MRSFEYGDDKIGGIELMIAIPSMLIGVGVLSLPRNISSIMTGSDGWIVIVLTGGISILTVWLMAKLAASFPHHSFLSYASIIVSKPIATVLTFLFAISFISFAAYDMRVLGHISQQYLFNHTPVEIVTVSFLLVVVYAVAGSRAALFRLNIIFFPIITIILLLVLLINTAEEAKTNGNYQLILSNQFVAPPGLGTPSGGGGGGEKAFMNISASGESIYDIAQDLANQTSKIPFFEHIKIVIVSEEVAAIPQLFANVMDVFIRNRDTRRGIKVIIAKGKAKDILNIQPEIEKLPSKYIDRILDNSLTKTSELKPVRVGDIHEYLLTKTSFVLSEVTSDETSIYFEGGAVYKGDADKLIGSLNLKEMIGFELITDQRVQGPILVNFNNHLTTYSLREENSKIKIDTHNPEDIKIDIQIKLEGEIQETFGTVLLQKAGVIEALEKEISNVVKEIATQSIKKAQQELEADIFGFRDNLEKFHYDTWQEIKKDWEQGENYFAQSTVNVTVKAEVHSDGVVEKSKK
ncbi:Ger(x)C family spore germination protein [Paucisalibacillus sp. EB02]|uniref:Ger(x)C family spore germination protein n=1 Tax=Paucisalibacillus sp. EB02 TaxID=1347087 RepID=UPI0004AFAF84|nr:Ger(x)C family spore germination protein [Paucisalibacillus sp. EB02]